MPRSLPLAFLALTLLSGAVASPATELFSAATRMVQEGYYGWSTKDFKSLSESYAQQLDLKCAPNPETCAYQVGRDSLTSLFKEYGDAHTNVRDPEGAERLNEIIQDQAVQRTGVKVVRMEGGLLVTSVMPGSPADLAGVRRFDLFTSVAGQPAGKQAGVDAPIGPNEFVRLERAAQPFAVELRRAGQADKTLTLTTALLKARDEPTLAWRGEDGKVAVVQLPSFLSTDSAELFLAKVNEAKAAGARALVVDLRFNGGGNLMECVAAASIYGPVIYQTQYRLGSYSYTGLLGQRGNYLDTYFARPEERVWDGPGAVLVSENTASCAEVFSYFAQRAGVTIVGQATKGVANSGVIFQALPDGGVVSVTILKAFNREGKPLPDHITPDIVSATDITELTVKGQDTTLTAALRSLEPMPAVAEGSGLNGK